MRARARAAVGHAAGLAPEVLMVVLLVLLYSAARLLARADAADALQHAVLVLDLESWLRLPREQDLQALLLAREPLVRAANSYYAVAHLPVTGAVLLWLLVFRRRHYLWARRSLMTATGAALVVYVLLPVAPPRMLTWVGFVDTPALYGQSVYGPPTAGSLSNQFAAMPSMHVGWAVLLAVVMVAATSGRARLLWLVHPVVTTLVVIGTGNHFWLDGIVGAALAGVALLLHRGVLGQPDPERAVLVRPQQVA